jgi:hypothetical protein
MHPQNRGAMPISPSGAPTTCRSLIGPALIIGRRTAATLLFGGGPLLPQPRFTRRSRWPCLLAALRRRCRCRDYVAQFTQTIVDVAALIAVSLAHDHQFVAIVEATSKASQQADANVLWQRGARRYAPAQLGLRVDLVNVLPARAGAPHERKTQLARRDGNPTVDAERLHDIYTSERDVANWTNSANANRDCSSRWP